MLGIGRALRNSKKVRPSFYRHPSKERYVKTARVQEPASPSWKPKLGNARQERRAEVHTEKRFGRERTGQEKDRGHGRQAASAGTGGWFPTGRHPTPRCRGFDFIPNTMAEM